ncbi:MAG: type II toxin-antitoxin system Phd/YefM family antitoxin [Steroidobacteraceae bacterium]
MPRHDSKGAEEARNQLPALIEAAADGRSTVITRHGRPVAALVPIDRMDRDYQASLLELKGSGRGLWGKSSAATLRRLRSEWDR